MLSPEQRERKRASDRRRRANFTDEQRAKYVAYDKAYQVRRRQKYREDRLKIEDLEREIMLDKLDAKLQIAFKESKTRLIAEQKKAKPYLSLHSPLFNRVY